MMSRSCPVSLLILCALVGPLMACNAVEGNGEFAQETRNTPLFDVIEVDGGEIEVITSVTHKPGQRQVSLLLEGDSNLLPLVETHISGRRLILDSECELDPSLPLRLRIAMPSLRAVEINGSGRVTVENVGAESVVVDVSGSGDVSLEGQVGTLRGDISGSGVIRARGLEARHAQIDISGSGRAFVCADERLSADVSGSGEVTYYCEPGQVDRDISGSGNIRPGREVSP